MAHACSNPSWNHDINFIEAGVPPGLVFKLCIYFIPSRDVASAIIDSDQWRLGLRGMYERNRRYTTPFRELIVKMPGNWFTSLGTLGTLCHT